MADIPQRILVLCIYVILQKSTAGVQGQCTTPPYNLAVYEGTQNTILTCNSPTKVSYVVRATSDELNNARITNYDDIVASSYTNLFGVNENTLIIKTAQTRPTIPPISTAGLYVINLNGSTTKYGAKLLIVRQDPNCTCRALNATHIQLNCSILYGDSSIHPIYANMNWTSNGLFYKSDTPVRARLNGNEFTSSSVFAVKSYDPANYECTVTFAKPMDLQFPYVATNAPAFSASCTAPFCGYTTPPWTVATTTATSATTTTDPPITTTQVTNATSTTTTDQSTYTTTPELPTTPGCDCSATTACPTLEKNCTHPRECSTVGVSWTEIYEECVVKAELFARCDDCCPDRLVCGVVVTLRNDSRWLIYDSICDDNICEMVVVEASCMSSDWKLLTERKITTSGVRDFVNAGYVWNSLNDCSRSCYNMINLP